MTVDTRRLLGGVAGGLLAGAVLSVLLIRGERDSGEPSELAALEREGSRRLGLATPAADELPDLREQLVIQGGHLLLSAVAGASYALAVPDDAPPVPAGAGFGMAFYAAMHWVAGPMLRVKAPEWRSEPATIGMHALNHVAFGLATAFGARLAARRE